MHDQTLLQIVQNAQGELGLIQSTSVVGNTDPTTLQMYLLANRILDEMRRMHPTGWSACMTEYNLIVNPPIGQLVVAVLWGKPVGRYRRLRGLNQLIALLK